MKFIEYVNSRQSGDVSEALPQMCRWAEEYAAAEVDRLLDLMGGKIGGTYDNLSFNQDVPTHFGWCHALTDMEISHWEIQGSGDCKDSLLKYVGFNVDED